MEKLSQLKTDLSSEWLKGRGLRNDSLIKQLQEQIKTEKSILTQQYAKRFQEKQKEEAANRVLLVKKRNEKFKNLREAKQKERIENENRQREKLAKKNEKVKKDVK